MVTRESLSFSFMVFLGLWLLLCPPAPLVATGQTSKEAHTEAGKSVVRFGFFLVSLSIFGGVTVINNLAASQRPGFYNIYQPEIWIAALAQLISFAFGAIFVGFFLLLNALWGKNGNEAEFSKARLQVLPAKAEVYKSEAEHEKALELLDSILGKMR